MTEFEPSQPDQDKLFLSGKLQVDTAIDALAATDTNSPAIGILRAQRQFHELASSPEAQDDLKVCLEGEQTAAMKADIITGASRIEQNKKASISARIAARALLDALSTEK